jgi:hypothetical protein
MSAGRTFFSRILLDKANHTYLGYELVIEPQPANTYLATFGRLGITPLDIAASYESANASWTMLELPAIPEPRMIDGGHTFNIDLFVDSATGDKLLDEISLKVLHPFSALTHRPPTVSGPLRDFSVADAEFEILQPRVTLNGSRQIAGGPASLRDVRGALAWFYFPEHGRYVLSLLPRADLGFKKAGEVRGGLLSFTLDGDSVRLECMSSIASGGAAYNLYVLHDEDWEPISDRQKDWPAAGSITAEELAALARK